MLKPRCWTARKSFAIPRRASRLPSRLTFSRSLGGDRIGKEGRTRYRQGSMVTGFPAGALRVTRWRSLPGSMAV